MKSYPATIIFLDQSDSKEVVIRMDGKKIDLIPKKMRKREDGYKLLKRKIYPEEMPDRNELGEGD